MLVPGSIKLDRLHAVLQVVMGWSGTHLYLFDISDDQYSEPDDEEDLEDELDASAFRLDEVTRVGERFSYLYDFGDDWDHEVVVESGTTTGAALKVAVCLDGARACPPEDCGGPLRYEELLVVLADPTHPGYSEIIDWIGDGFDPANFDLVAVNVSLQRV